MAHLSLKSIEFAIRLATELKPVLDTLLTAEQSNSPTELTFSHCKDTIPKIWNKYFQERNCVATVPISPHSCVCERFIYFLDLPILLQENMWTDAGNIYIAHKHMIVEIGTEASQFSEKEYINRIFVAVHFPRGCTQNWATVHSILLNYWLTVMYFTLSTSFFLFI